MNTLKCAGQLYTITAWTMLTECSPQGNAPDNS